MIAIAALLGAWPSTSAAAITSCSGSGASFDGGIGTSADPFRVSTQAQLAAIGTGANRLCAYRQTRDIALTGEWTPLASGAAPFKGEYDGDGHAITGISITIDGSYLGLFSYTDGGAVIQNLRLAGTINAPGSYGVGGLIGLADRPTTITNVHSSVDVTASGRAGGLIGWVAESIVRRSSASGTVTVSGGDVGGLVGLARSSYGSLPAEVSDSYATGAVTGGDSYEGVAGLVGRVEVGGGSYRVTIERSFSSGHVTGGSGTRVDCSYGYCITFTGTTGGLLARYSASTAYSANLTVTDSFWDTQTSDRATTADDLGTGLTTAQARVRSTFSAAGWDIAAGWADSAVWSICEGSSYPYLSGQYGESPCPPDAPGAPIAVAGDARATVTVSPGAGGGGTPTSITVRAVEDAARSCTITGSAGSCEVTGLTNGVTYTFVATAANANGSSPSSAASNAVTPTAAAGTGTADASATAPAAPTGIRWSKRRVTTARLVATFDAAPDTRYLISAYLPSRRLAWRAGRTVRGFCAVSTPSGARGATARCVIRLRTPGRWRISITPVSAGIRGTAAVKRIRITLPVPQRPTATSGRPESVTG
ncbi:MAG: hypothetical protein ACO3KD_03345 [Gaiellales bacterium]